MAEREVDRELRYRVLQNELRIILSYLRTADADGLLQLRPDLLFDFQDGACMLAVTWAYLADSHVQVDLFTMSDRSMGSIEYLAPEKNVTTVNADVRQQFTANAMGRREQRAEHLFETAPPAPVREPRRLFGREVRGDWVTADLVRPSDVRLFLGAIGTPVPAPDVRAARSRTRRTGQRLVGEYEAAVSDRLMIVVARSENPEPEWSGVEGPAQHERHRGRNHRPRGASPASAAKSGCSLPPSRRGDDTRRGSRT